MWEFEPPPLHPLGTPLLVFSGREATQDQSCKLCAYRLSAVIVSETMVWGKRSIGPKVL